MIEVPDFLVPIEIAEKLKEIGFDKKVHFFFLYYQGWEILKKRGDKYGFITSNSCNPNVIFNYNLKENHLSVPTWNEVIEWFSERIKMFNLIIQEVDTSNYINGIKDFFIDDFLTEKGKYKVESNKCFCSMIKGIRLLKHIKGNDKTGKVYTNRKDVLISSIDYLIDYYKNNYEKE